jgi:hypothetical protein
VLPSNAVWPKRWPVLASFAVAAIAGWMAYALVPTNVDVAWLLVACDRLLDGARLHVDVVEVNPPFSIWLYMPFAFAQRMTGLRSELWLSIGLPLFALLSVGLSARILGRAGLMDDRAAWLAPVALFILIGLFAEDFGQREQFATIALLPWLALLAARDSTQDFKAGTRLEWILAGLGAAMFVMTKPPLAVPALGLPALFLAIKRRSLRPILTAETLLGMAVTFAYLAWLTAFHMHFFLDLVPVLRELYLPAQVGIIDMILDGPVRLFAILAIATWLVARPGRIDGLALLALLAALGYVPAFVLMGKGWTYQALPILLLGLLGFLLQLRHVWLAEMQLLAKAGATLGLAMLALIMWAGQPFATAERRAGLEQAAAAIGSVVQRPLVASIGTRLQPAHPLTRLVGGQYRSRYPALWMVDNTYGLIRANGGDLEKVTQLEALSARFIAQTASDIERERPDIIFDAGTDGTVGQAAVHADPEIARLLDGYRVLYRDKMVTVFVRADLAAPSEASPAL